MHAKLKVCALLIMRYNLTFWGALRSMRLHCDVSIQVVQGAVGLLATVPSALVHALNLLVSATWTLVLLGTWNWDEGVDLAQWVMWWLHVLRKLVSAYKYSNEGY